MIGTRVVRLESMVWLALLMSCDRTPPPEPPRTDPPVLLVLAVDGLDHRILTERFGDLPFLGGLVARGALLRLRSEEPMLSPRLWNTMATGLPPEDHGVTGFTFREPGTYRTILAHALLRLRPTFWEIASREGLKVGVVNWLTTYPAAAVHGTVVSGDFIARWRPTPGATFPEEASGRLMRFVDGSAELEREAERARGVLPADSEDAKLLREYVARDRRAALLGAILSREERPRLLTVYFAGIDIVCHVAWEGLDGGPSVWGYHVYVDRLCEHVARALPPGSSVMVVSDHGFRARRTSSPPEIDVNRVLAALGLLAYDGEGRIDFSRTKLFNLDEKYSPEKPLFANVAGREPQGIVVPDELAAFLTRARGLLLSLRTEPGDRPLFSRVAASRGPGSPRVAWPELVATVDPALDGDDVLLLPDGRGRIAVSRLAFGRKPGGGEHDSRGVIILPFAMGSDDDATLRDVAPTVLSLLRLPASAEWGGTNLTRRAVR